MIFLFVIKTHKSIDRFQAVCYTYYEKSVTAFKIHRKCNT